MMKALIMLVCVLLISGCSSPNEQTQSHSAVPLLTSRLTVDDFLKLVSEGKTIEDLKLQLGIPMLSLMRPSYFLADGSVVLMKDHLVVKRTGGTEGIIIQRPSAPISSDTPPNADS